MRDVPIRTLIPLRHAEAREGPSLARRAQTASSRAVAPRAVAPRAASGRATGFTLIEMIVVVTIIGLLLAIAVPVSVGLVNSQKAKATRMTMQALEVAIDTFAAEKPVTDGMYRSLFGHFPPSPATSFILQSNVPAFAQSGPTGFTTGEYRFAADPGTKQKFEVLVRNYLVPSVDVPVWRYNNDATWFRTDHPNTDKYLSIETLVLFLRQLSPQAGQTITRLDKYVTNKDADAISWDSDGLKATVGNTALDLLEVTDAWGNPLRYAVQSPVQTPGAGTLPIRWELRSSGPDGKFTPTFNLNDGSFLSEEAAGDDVILRGP